MAKNSLPQIFGFIMVFSFVSTVFVFIAFLNIGITNDYILFNVQEVVDDLENTSIISNNTRTELQSIGDTYTSFNFHLDDLWFFSYVAFFVSSVAVAYHAKKQNNFQFLGMMFYGVMVILFGVTIFSTLALWFRDNILLAIMPSVTLVMPKYYFYLENVGIFSAIHIVICMVINMMDLDFSKIISREKQEKAALKDDEIV